MAAAENLNAQLIKIGQEVLEEHQRVPETNKAWEILVNAGFCEDTLRRALNGESLVATDFAEDRQPCDPELVRAAFLTMKEYGPRICRLTAQVAIIAAKARAYGTPQ